VALFAPHVLAQGHGAHVHGIATLQVAVDGPTLTLRFESPLENLVGFERAPKTDRQKAAIRDMESSLSKPDAHFIPTPVARCASVSSKLSSPVHGESKAPAEKKETQKADAKGGEKKSAHGQGKHEHEEEHSELTGEFVFRCENPGGLQNLEVKVFDSFRRLRRVDVQVASPRGQKAARLTSKQRLVAW